MTTWRASTKLLLVGRRGLWWARWNFPKMTTYDPLIRLLVFCVTHLDRFSHHGITYLPRCTLGHPMQMNIGDADSKMAVSDEGHTVAKLSTYFGVAEAIVADRNMENQEQVGRMRCLFRVGCCLLFFLLFGLAWSVECLALTWLVLASLSIFALLSDDLLRAVSSRLSSHDTCKFRRLRSWPKLGWTRRIRFTLRTPSRATITTAKRNAKARPTQSRRTSQAFLAKRF